MDSSSNDRIGWVAGMAVVLLVSWMSAATAQPAGCTTVEAADPPRRVLQCRNGVRITAEAAAALGLRGDTASLDGAAIFIDVARGQKSRFDVVTPHAVASVRGTRFAVDVSQAHTSVFVQDGTVSVRRRRSRKGVLLAPGQGVDVGSTDGPLEVKQWGAERAAQLLARLGERSR